MYAHKFVLQYNSDQDTQKYLCLIVGFPEVQVL